MLLGQGMETVGVLREARRQLTVELTLTLVVEMGVKDPVKREQLPVEGLEPLGGWL